MKRFRTRKYSQQLVNMTSMDRQRILRWWQPARLETMDRLQWKLLFPLFQRQQQNVMRLPVWIISRQYINQAELCNFHRNEHKQDKQEWYGLKQSKLECISMSRLSQNKNSQSSCLVLQHRPWSLAPRLCDVPHNHLDSHYLQVVSSELQRQRDVMIIPQVVALFPSSRRCLEIAV